MNIFFSSILRSFGIDTSEPLTKEEKEAAAIIVNGGSEVKYTQTRYSDVSSVRHRSLLDMKLRKLKQDPIVWKSKPFGDEKAEQTRNVAMAIALSLSFLTEYKVRVPVHGSLYHKNGIAEGPVRIWVGRGLASGTPESWDTACDVRVFVGKGDNKAAWIDIAPFTVILLGKNTEHRKVFKFKDEPIDFCDRDYKEKITEIATEQVAKYLTVS